MDESSIESSEKEMVIENDVELIIDYQANYSALLSECINESPHPEDAQCMAGIEKNYTLCNHWDNESDYDYCLDEVSVLRLLKENVSCSIFVYESMQRFCEALKGDSCEKIKDDDSVYNLCIALKRDDTSLLGEDEDVYCYFNLFDGKECKGDYPYYEAYKNKNSSLCITNKSFESCKNSLNRSYDQALNQFYSDVLSGNASCSEIPRIEECEEYVQQKKDENSVFQVMLKRNASVCPDIVNESLALACESIITRNVSLCTSLDEKSKYHCLVALKEYGIRACDNLTTPSLKKNCELY